MKAARIRELLDRHGLRLHRERGQNFLLGEAPAERLAALAGVEAGDTVLEVGTGLGTLTRALAARAARVVTIEIDSGLVRALKSESLLPENVELLHADARDLDLGAMAAKIEGRVRLVANLPYSAATPLLRRCLDWGPVFEDWSVMVQREVGKRLLAEPGSRDYGSLSVLHQLCVDVELATQLGGERFFPRAKVRSSFLRITPQRTPRVRPEVLPVVERIARAAFNQRRKMIGNSLSALAPDADALAAWFAAAGVSSKERPQALLPERWLALAQHVPLDC
ncbi:MAG: 16S rRNA (adenine(1518)-N(6)/adenine(1519)-N(6))-dimethyltransferase RsmA [Myxococcota bacterium]